jgi:hypothetical protein
MSAYVRIPILSIIASLLFTSLTLAQSSLNYDLRWSVATNSGGQRSSPNFIVQDVVGQSAGEAASSASVVLQGGFAAGLYTIAAGITPTPVIPTPAPGGDNFEDDDVCLRAKTLAVDGSNQNHTFHDNGDMDWLRFRAEINKTYILRVRNLNKADVGIALFDSCDLAPSATGNDSFGTETAIEFESTKTGDYFVQLQQQADPPAFGNDVTYQVSVVVDTTPPTTPANTRCTAIDPTTIEVQWRKNPERDISQYIVQYSDGAVSANLNVPGANTTFAQITGLTPGQTYSVKVLAQDYSENSSGFSVPLPCAAQTGGDATVPALTVQTPATSTVTTANNMLTFAGMASDAGGNLSRVRVRNLTVNITGWDYNLSGASSAFRVQDVSMALGANTVEIEAFDAAGNSSKKTLTVNRQGVVQGAVLIIAGRNEGNGLQNNIYNAANRAYRIFKTAGFSDELIFYIAPGAQDADGNGISDVDAAPGNSSAVQNALLTWAAGKVGPGNPLFVYMIDHGFQDKFCLDGCTTGAIAPAELNGWLNALESSSGVDQVSIVIEACLSGSFITRSGGGDPNSLTKPGRVVITSTSDNKNAYASADGAYFSDAFFSCLADSQDLRTCFEQAKAAVNATGVSQSPQMDDNGDATYTVGDGTIAQARFITRFFGALRPTITGVRVERQGTNGLLNATVVEGAEPIGLVWAAIYPPGFSEPSDAAANPTLNLNVPTVQLQPDPATPGRYVFNYVNGFTATGDYRIIFYAQDVHGIHALPKTPGAVQLYLPLIQR